MRLFIFAAVFPVDALCRNGYLDADEFRELKEFIETEKRLLMNAL
jgi:hypothetical protein